MVWHFIGFYIINRILHGRAEIRNFSSRVEKNISLIRLAHSWNIFQHSQRNFVSPRGHVISSLSICIYIYIYIFFFFSCGDLCPAKTSLWSGRKTRSQSRPGFRHKTYYCLIYSRERWYFIAAVRVLNWYFQTLSPTTVVALCMYGAISFTHIHIFTINVRSAAWWCFLTSLADSRNYRKQHGRHFCWNRTNFLFARRATNQASFEQLWYRHDKFVNSPEVATSLSREVLSKNPR